MKKVSIDLTLKDCQLFLYCCFTVIGNVFSNFLSIFMQILREQQAARCQFHQRFTHAFFVRKFIQSQNVTRKKAFVRKIRAFNIDEIDNRAERERLRIRMLTADPMDIEAQRLIAQVNKMIIKFNEAFLLRRC